MKKVIKLFFIHVVISACIYTNASYAKVKKMNILNNKPIFQLDIKAFGTRYFIHVNGVIIHQERFSEGQLSTSLPINQWMRSGMNAIGIYVYPEKRGGEISANASVAITLTVSDKDNPDLKYPVGDIVFSGKMLSDNKPVINSSPSGKFDSDNNFITSGSGDVEVYDITQKDSPTYKGALLFSRNINIPSSLPLWAFFGSDDLPDYHSMADDEYYKNMDILLAEYMKIQKALETGDVDSVISMFSERNKELDAAFYLPPGTMEQRIRSSLEEAVNKQEYELLDLKQDYLNFSIEDNNKLASLTRVGDKPAIVLNFKNGIGSQNFPLIFRMEKGKWILTR